jgi:hypothetical protein
MRHPIPSAIFLPLCLHFPPKTPTPTPRARHAHARTHRIDHPDVVDEDAEAPFVLEAGADLSELGEEGVGARAVCLWV